MKTKWIAIMGTSFLTASLIATGISLADSSGSDQEIRNGTIQIPRTTEADYPGMARISLDEAIKSALRAVKGKVLKSELEDEDGFLVYEVEVVEPDKTIKEVMVDAGNGKVLAIEKESGENDKEGESESGEERGEHDDD